jgi:hypothetical protein
VPVIAPIQPSFAGGEISPRSRGRVDSELYKRALARCENFEPTPQGSLRMRNGSELVRDLALDGVGQEVRLVAFRMADESDHIVAFIDGELRLYAVTGAQVAAEFVTSVSLVTNGDFETNLGAWNVGAATAVWEAPGHAKLTGDVGSSPAWANMLWQAVTITDPTLAPTLKFHVVLASSYWGKPVTLRVTFSTVDPATWWDAGTFWTDGTEVFNAEVTTDSFHELTITPPAAGTYYLTFQVKGTVVAQVNLDDISLLVSAAPSSSIAIASPWATADLPDVQFVADSGKDRMIFAHRSASPYYLQKNADGTWSFGPIPFTAKPAEWGGQNWPGVIEIYQGRLWLGGTPNDRRRLWASVAGSLFDFSLTVTVDGVATPTAASSIDIKVATKGAIKWVQGGRVLLVGTDLGEHSIVAQAGVITASDLQVRDESAYGSAPVQALNAGPFALFVSGDSRKLRAINYDLASSNWSARDITFAAEHITEGLIKEILHARDPHGTLVLLLETGALVACTFDQTEQVAAWYRITAGDVHSACVTHGPEGSFLWLAASRGPELLLERLLMSEGAAYADSSVTGASTGLVFAGLDHLEGLEVCIVNDGALEPNQVVSGGQVTLARAGAVVTVGLPFRAVARTLKREGGNPSGTSQGMIGRHVKTTLRLNDSAVPLVAGSRCAPVRHPSTPMGTPEGRISEDVSVRGLGWEQDTSILIEQDLPLRTEVLAVFGLFQGNEV